MLESASNRPVPVARPALRKKLLEQREQFVASAQSGAAGAALLRYLGDVLAQLEPQRLGLCWALGSEFNAALAFAGDAGLAKLPMALCFAQRAPTRMHYRAWDGRMPVLVDECGIASCDGAPVEPDVVLVPCIGFTPEGFRLGYGGGYFDRWLALHPQVTAVGVAWAVGAIQAGAYEPQPHDIAMTLIVTEHGVV